MAYPLITCYEVTSYFPRQRSVSNLRYVQLMYMVVNEYKGMGTRLHSKRVRFEYPSDHLDPKQLQK